MRSKRHVTTLHSMRTRITLNIMLTTCLLQQASRYKTSQFQMISFQITSHWGFVLQTSDYFNSWTSATNPRHCMIAKYKIYVKIVLLLLEQWDGRDTNCRLPEKDVFAWRIRNRISRRKATRNRAHRSRQRRRRRRSSRRRPITIPWRVIRGIDRSSGR